MEERAHGEAARQRYIIFPMALPHGSVQTPGNLLELKKWWLFNEWDPTCQFHPVVQHYFPARATIHPVTGNAANSAVDAAFQHVRGQFPLIWGPIRENGNWIKVEVPSLTGAWLTAHVHRPYPTGDTFAVTELHGLVMERVAGIPGGCSYRLLEGNHRVSAFLNANQPAVHSVIFVVM